MTKPIDISNPADVLDLGFEMFDDRAEKETTYMISPKIFRANGKTTTINALKKETLTDIFNVLPEEGEYVHIVSNGTFDYFTFVPVFVELLGKIDVMYSSTWTMNRTNIQNLVKHFDAGEILDISCMIGLYFKRKETGIYTSLLDGLMKRNQRVIACNTHAKIMLFQRGTDYYVIEGSANWTGNPRIEQNIVVKSEQLYMFHKQWMDEFFSRSG